MENKIANSNIAVSILGVEDKQKFLVNLKSLCEAKGYNDVIIHYDIMDGIFVKNKGVDYMSVDIAHNLGFYTDVHLMVESPMVYISKIVAQGANSITVHYEIENLYEVLIHLNMLKSQKKIQNIGLAIKPDTKIHNLHEYLYLVDMILIMSVEPGLGGQKYIEAVNEKLVGLKTTDKILQVDGGVNLDTIECARKCGVTSFVVGSYLTYDTKNLEENLDKIYNMKS